MKPNVYIIIGQSGSGKTTFARKLMGECIYCEEDIVKITKCENMTAIGDYTTNKREKGTDTLPYNSQEKIIRQVLKLVKDGEPVLMEGDRITNRSVFQSLEQKNLNIKLYLLTCSLKTSIKRLREANSRISLPFLKMTKTKSRNLFIEYGSKFNGEIIKTEE